MRLSDDQLHNPFKNRFHDPVTWRLDEMQAHANVIRLRQRTRNDNKSYFPESPSAQVENSHYASDADHDNGAFAGAFALLIVLVALMIVLFRVF